MTVGERIKALRKERGLSQNKLAKLAGIAQPTLSAIENTTKSPNIVTVGLIAAALGVTPNALLGDTRKNDGSWIPVLGDVAAGIPSDAIEDTAPEDYEQLDESMMNDGFEYFALKLKGDSMSPRMTIGDVVIVRKQSEVENNEIAVVQIDRETATVKRIRKTDQGIWLMSDNIAYQPFFFSAEEAATRVRILGKVVELRAKF